MAILKKKRRKIRIAGAGISGLVAGIILAKNGYQVEIFEKRPRIGSFFQKDIHSLRNYAYSYDIIEEYKKCDIEISNFFPVFKEFRFAPSGKSLEIYSDNKPLFYNIIRGYKDKRSLDNELLHLATFYKVRVCFNKKINKDNPKVDIVATGASQPSGIAYGGHYRMNKNIKLDSIYYLVDNNIAPKGYIYLVPFQKEFSLLLATTKIENKDKLKKRFNLLRQNNVIKKVLDGATYKNGVFGFVSFNPLETAIKDGKLYIGEAAGFIDASTGFGTHHAIISGYLAAKSIINNENYDKLWKEHFGKELKEKYLKRKQLESLNDKDYERIIEGLFKKNKEKVSLGEYKNYKDAIS